VNGEILPRRTLFPSQQARGPIAAWEEIKGQSLSIPEAIIVCSGRRKKKPPAGALPEVLGGYMSLIERFSFCC
jgi:hypothetical protein